MLKDINYVNEIKKIIRDSVYTNQNNDLKDKYIVNLWEVTKLNIKKLYNPILYKKKKRHNKCYNKPFHANINLRWRNWNGPVVDLL